MHKNLNQKRKIKKILKYIILIPPPAPGPLIFESIWVTLFQQYLKKKKTYFFAQFW